MHNTRPYLLLFWCLFSAQSLTIWSASMSTLFTVSFLLQKLNRSSKLGPSRSITMTLYSPSIPYQRRFGMPAAHPKCNC